MSREKCRIDDGQDTEKKSAKDEKMWRVTGKQRGYCTKHGLEVEQFRIQNSFQNLEQLKFSASNMLKEKPRNDRGRRTAPKKQFF